MGRRKGFCPLNLSYKIFDSICRRKYYINGKWYWTDSLLSKKEFIEVYRGTIYSKESVYGVCDSSCDKDVNKCYECLYRKVNKGVLP